MPESTRRRELGRGERVLSGVWRLRLPLPWPGVPHCNAWAVRAGDGVVLFDCGLHTGFAGAGEEGSLAQLVRAMAQVGLKLEDVRLLVCTHAHSDHYGQAADVIDASGCELWMHPNHAHMTAAAEDPQEALARRLEVARMSGVPVAPLAQWAEAARKRGYGIKRIVEPDRDLVPGVVVETDLGPWTVHETPGHAPSHVCLHQAERRILISGDHLLGRVSLYFDYGWTPDPVGEFLDSLDKVQASTRGCASPATHARSPTSSHTSRRTERSSTSGSRACARSSTTAGPITAYDIVPLLYGEPITTLNAGWWLPETLCYLRHLEVDGRARARRRRARALGRGGAVCRSAFDLDAAHALAGEDHRALRELGEQQACRELDGEQRAQHDELRGRGLLGRRPAEDQADERPRQRDEADAAVWSTTGTRPVWTARRTRARAPSAPLSPSASRVSISRRVVVQRLEQPAAGERRGRHRAADEDAGGRHRRRARSARRRRPRAARPSPRAPGARSRRAPGRARPAGPAGGCRR